MQSIVNGNSDREQLSFRKAKVKAEVKVRAKVNAEAKIKAEAEAKTKMKVGNNYAE